MFFGYFTLFVALMIEVVGAYYSITGLAAIFSGAVIPILIMGGSLEVGKVTAAVWLKNNWHRASLQFRLYLLPAVTLLMFITSMGIFGFLSKAHNDQNLVSGDVQSKISIYDEKIKIQKDNIESARKALQQMDAAVDQTMSRSNDEKGADKATAIRRGQARERGNLQGEIARAQTEIVKLNDLRAPIAAEVRKVEAEVGPIKYIAKLIYGDNPDANILEKAVVWVIMMIVAVFDPLALVLILAAQQSIRWARGEDQEEAEKTKEEAEQSQADKILKQGVANSDPTAGMPLANDIPVFEREEIPLEEPVVKQVSQEETKNKILSSLDSMWIGAKQLVKQDTESEHAPIETEIINDIIEDDDHLIDELEKQARRNWKELHPNETIKKHRLLHDRGLIDNLPWNHPDYQTGLQLGLQADNVPASHAGEVKGFGISFPVNPDKGDMFLRVDQLPSVLYKFNGNQWIEVDKGLSDQHAYDKAYIDHLIEKISTGEYDPELLSDAERDSIEQRLNNPQA
jgi:hypothetical protein